MESIPKSKKNKRCVLHSLDTHKTKPLGMWMDVWDVLSPECRDEVVLVECDCLMRTLENYLRKHRFCSECKAKVLRAYSILVGDLDSSTEKGYCRALYDGISCCHEKRHIHVSCETDYIAKLIGRAEPELTGSRRERHAKTLDIAQEEVLTCIGIHLYERLHRIWQKLRAEEQTWQILFYLGVDALRKNFEMELERKQGISQLELTCLELLEEEQAKELRREQKRQKRKKKKNQKTKGDIECVEIEADCDKDKENCKCDENTNDTSVTCASCDEHNLLSNENSPGVGRRPVSASTALQSLSPERHKVCGPCQCDTHKQGTKQAGTVVCRSDCGYSSGHEGCDSCDTPSSNDGSDVACFDGICNHEEDSPLCHRSDVPDVCQECCNSTNRSSPKRHSHSNNNQQYADTRCRPSSPSADVITDSPKYGTALSLQDMLEACVSGDEEEEDFISEEEIQHFRANQSVLNSKRQELRETLRQRFANMCMCHNPAECTRANHVHSMGVNGVTATAESLDCLSKSRSPCSGKAGNGPVRPNTTKKHCFKPSAK